MPDQITRVEKDHPVKTRLKRFLNESGTFCDSDDETIDLYVETYDFYQRMREELQDNDLLMEFTNKVGATNLVKNPLAIEITKTVQVLSGLLKSMGLTPIQRKVFGNNDELDDFDRFCSGDR